MKYTKAVSATLASALAVGMVPAMALADDAQLELMDTAEAVKAFNEGAVTAAAWSNSDAYDFTVGAINSKQATGNAIYVVPSQVTPKGGTAIALGGANAELYKVTYVKAGADGKPSAEAVVAPKEAGNYFAVVTATEKSGYAGGVVYLPFSLVNQALTGATAYEVDPEDLSDLSDNQFMYDGEAQNIAFKIGNKVLAEGVDYTVKYFKAGADIYGTDYTTTAPINQGTYTAVLTGIGAYAGSTASHTFTVSPFLFAGKTVVVADIAGNATALPTTVTSIDGSTAMNDEVKLSYTKWPGNETGSNPTASKGGLGQYTATVLPLDANNVDDPNFGTNASKEITFNKVTNLATFKYDGAAWDDEVTVVLNDKKSGYDTDDIEVYDASGKLLDASKYTVSVDGPSQDFSVAGKYTVTVQVKAADFAYALGGTTVAKVNVVQDVVNASSNVYVTFKGAVKNSVSVVYANDDLVDDFGITLYDSKNNAVTNGFVKTFYDANGKVVTSVKDAGKYTLKVTHPDYTIADGEIPIEIKPIEVTAIKANNMTAINGKNAYAYNAGNDISFGVSYHIEQDFDGVKDDNEWTGMTGLTLTNPPVTLVITKDGKAVTALNELGTYKMSLQLNDVNEKNYVVSAETIEVEVATPLDFIDVPATHWAYEVIKTAKGQGYVNGYGDGKLYGPDNAIKRADFVCVLYNMAGCPDVTANNGNFAAGMEYDLSFTDVNERAYYAPALAWAEEAGIANGWVENGKKVFGPSKNITRQEALCMLANYADMVGDFAAPADADALLAKYADGGKTSKWAKDSVAWAVSEKIAGNGKVLNPLGNITRAEVAAIAVNYQPVRLV